MNPAIVYLDIIEFASQNYSLVLSVTYRPNFHSYNFMQSNSTASNLSPIYNCKSGVDFSTTWSSLTRIDPDEYLSCGPEIQGCGCRKKSECVAGNRVRNTRGINLSDMSTRLDSLENSLPKARLRQKCCTLARYSQRTSLHYKTGRYDLPPCNTSQPFLAARKSRLRQER